METPVWSHSIHQNHISTSWRHQYEAISFITTISLHHGDTSIKPFHSSESFPYIMETPVWSHSIHQNHFPTSWRHKYEALPFIWIISLHHGNTSMKPFHSSQPFHYVSCAVLERWGASSLSQHQKPSCIHSLHQDMNALLFGVPKCHMYYISHNTVTWTDTVI